MSAALNEQARNQDQRLVLVAQALLAAGTKAPTLTLQAVADRVLLAVHSMRVTEAQVVALVDPTQVEDPEVVLTPVQVAAGRATMPTGKKSMTRVAVNGIDGEQNGNEKDATGKHAERNGAVIGSASDKSGMTVSSVRANRTEGVLKLAALQGHIQVLGQVQALELALQDQALELDPQEVKPHETVVHRVPPLEDEVKLCSSLAFNPFHDQTRLN